MTKRNRQIVSTMWKGRGMGGYATNGGGGFCNLLRGDFEDLNVCGGFKPKAQKSYVKHHKHHSKQTMWNLSGSRMVTFG